MKFKKKPKVIDAYQWFTVSKYIEGVVRDVDYYRHPNISGKTVCKHCGIIMHNHGWIDTLEGGHIVCPGDWVITGVKGEKYPCKPDIFKETYDKVEKTFCQDCDDYKCDVDYCLPCFEKRKK